jgi:hypothetical protein
MHEPSIQAKIKGLMKKGNTKSKRPTEVYVTRKPEVVGKGRKRKNFADIKKYTSKNGNWRCKKTKKNLKNLKIKKINKKKSSQSFFSLDKFPETNGR